MAFSEAAALEFTGGIPYAVRSEGALLLDVLCPPAAPGMAGPSRPVTVFLHGGGWHEGDRGAAMHPWLAPLLAARGFVTVAPTYRLSGTATWPAPLDDVMDAVAWVHEHIAEFGGDPSRIGLWGYSAGAHLAALAALVVPTPGASPHPYPTVRAVALAACPSDLRDTPADPANEVNRLLGHHGTPAELRAISPVCRVRASPPRTLIAHGTADEIVPFAQGEALREAVRAAGGEVEWHPIEGGSHSWADAPVAGLDESAPSFGSLAAAFFERTLAP